MRLVVLGDPVDHSLSPLIHNSAFAATNLIGSYDRRPVDAAGMAEAVAEIRDGALDGASVTMPHKELAAQLADRLATSAQRVAVVNTLLRVGGAVVGHNTDIAGIEAAWVEAGFPADGPVLVLGAGGAAAAALVALEGHELTISSRRPEAVTALLQRVGVTATVASWGTPVSGAVVVNATPLGMQGESLGAAILDAAGGLFDMVYGSRETPSVQAIKQNDLPVADGQRMLLHQAAAAFELWTGHQAPLAAMEAALGGHNAAR